MQKSKDIKTNKHLPSLYSWFLIGIVFVFSFLFILATQVPISWGARGDNISGWAWSPQTVPTQTGLYTGFGLSSFNDCYCFYGDPPGSSPICIGGEACFSDMPLLPPYAPHGLSVDFATKEITGWVWSSSVGWICFGTSCSNAGGGKNYDTGRPELTENRNLAVVYDDSAGDPAPISGWAKIIAWPNDKGWLSLRGNFGLGGPAGQYGLTFSTSTLEIKGLAWNGFTDPGLPDSFSNYKGYGWFCIGAVNTAGYGDLCSRTGVQVSVPFLQTVDGDIYVRDIISPDYQPNAGLYNATYLILAGGTIERFISEELYLSDIPVIQRPSSYIVENYPLAVGLPREDQNYFNLLGSLDIAGLSETQDNEYGSFGGSYNGLTLDSSFIPNGDRVVVNGDLRIDGPVSFDVDYAGVTFIVKGDLLASSTASVVYDVADSQVSDFADLPSVSFIVEGDMFIDPAVTQLAGNFIVLGTPTGSVPAYKPCPASSDWANATGCGAIYTGASSDNTLTSYGIMMARKFFLERTTADVVNSVAEKIIYDGRLLVNPPPGFKDLSKALPVFSQVAPQ